MATIHPDYENVLSSEGLNLGDMQDIIEALGGGKAPALSDNRSESEKQKLTDSEKQLLREEAAKEIQAIPALRAEWNDFREKQGTIKVPTADLYAWVLTGNPKIRSLDYALKTLVKMLKDGRVPQKHKGETKDKTSAAIRLAIVAVYGAKEKEFNRNLELVPALMKDFYTARDQGMSQAMEKIIQRLAAPYFKGPLAQHHKCKMADLKYLFERLQRDVDAVKAARIKK